MMAQPSAQIMDYPGEPNEHGSVVLFLQLSAEGIVEDCVVERLSGVTSLDAAACAKARSMSFYPATDEEGDPVASGLPLTLHFIVPHARQTEADLPIGGNGLHITVLYDPERNNAQEANGALGQGQARPMRELPSKQLPSYPSRALRRNEQGRTHVTLDVSSQGKPERCSVVRTSGSEELDKATCKYAMKNVRYSPGTDFHGDEISGVALFSLNWALN